ncbi:MAG: SDR family NAD(P)-dependent oxidoreductase [Bradyrhizobium sp.]
MAQSNTFSGAGAKGIAGQAAYCAAKFGIVGLIKAAAVNHAKANIR